ncbi:MAG: response regulator transcription factor [Caldilineaceae bacterium]|nr:response regulator transcription factor [Caldilineaceae bacterium]
MIRVFLAHEHRLVNDAIATVLQDDAAIQIVGCAADKEGVLTHPQLTTCDVVLLSIKLPDNAALQVLRTLGNKNTHPKVLVTDLIQSNAAILQCVEEGAAGYVYEDESVTDLLQKIHCLSQDEFLVSPSVAAALITRIAELKRYTYDVEQNKVNSQWDELTPREREVLDLLAQGRSNLEIAETLVIEVGTVKNHVHSIFRKLDIRERQHAALFTQYLNGN